MANVSTKSWQHVCPKQSAVSNTELLGRGDKLALLPSVAQWIEQEPSNLLVAGSIPAGGTSMARLSEVSPFVYVEAEETVPACTTVPR